MLNILLCISQQESSQNRFFHFFKKPFCSLVYPKYQNSTEHQVGTHSLNINICLTNELVNSFMHGQRNRQYQWMVLGSASFGPESNSIVL